MQALPRRDFLRLTAASAAALATSPLAAADPASAEPTGARLPRWRGFNLLEKFTARRQGNPAYREDDLMMMQDWGFNFARLPVSYHCYAKAEPVEWLKFDEAQLKHFDEVVELGRKHGIHINLNLHRAPGYCVNAPAEPLSLWKDQQALDACCAHWANFAKRYKGIPNSRLSFDLLNEPPDIPEADYVRVGKALVAAIRAEDPQRLIIADGLKWGRDPVNGFVDLSIAQSTRGYDPMRVSHHKASWVNGADKWAEPTWPLKESNQEWNKDRLRRERIEPWRALEKRGVGVMVGEMGAHNQTPHAVALAWLKDQLELWQEAGWGWAMWNLRGSFGPLDNDRRDMAYEDFRGHKLDRAMIELLRAH